MSERLREASAKPYHQSDLGRAGRGHSQNLARTNSISTRLVRCSRADLKMIVPQTLRAQERQTGSTETAFAHASDRRRNRLERGTGLREDFHDPVAVNGDRECVAS